MDDPWGHLLGQEVRDIREDEDQDSMVTWWLWKDVGNDYNHPPEDFTGWVP